MRHCFLRASALGLTLIAASACAVTDTPAVASAANRQGIERAVAAPTRTPTNIVRDKYRHPVETLSFFGLRPGQTVVEIWPGGGWYTEILAPYAKQKGGTYYAVGPERGLAGIRGMAEKSPELYGHSKVALFPAATGDAKVPDGSADLVLTFRNVHNMMMGDKPFAEEAFRQMYAMLKPGGVLGVVDHRLPENADAAREKNSGYVKVSTVRRLAEAAGFRFVEASEINANPKDSADWPDGVWTLPPANRGPEAERAKYLAIGESDRMTLKFVKPM